jgi:hypothetical protein
VKTISLKKVSAVAVASLGFGLLSVVPAQAGTVTATITSINLTKATPATPTTGTAVTVNLGVVAPAQTITGGENIRFQAALTSVPAGGNTGVSAALTTGAGAAATLPTPWAGTSVVVAGGGLNLTRNADVTTAASNAAVSVTSSATVGAGSFSFTPQKAGVHVLTVWHDGGTAPDGNLGGNEVSQTISITVAAATGLSTSASIVRMGSVGLAVTQNSATTTLTNYTTTVDAVPRSAAKGTSAATNRIGQVGVVLVNTDGSAAGNLHTVTADITGSGLVLCNNNGTAADGTVRSSVLTLTGTDNVAVCHINSDGTSGPGTVTISVTDSVSGTKTVLGTETFTSYGDVAKLEVSTKNYTIGRAGFTTGKAANTRAAATEVGNAAAPSSVTTTSGTSTTPAFIVKATDSLGQAVTTLAVPTIVSGTTTVVTGGTCLLDDGAATVGSSTNGVGFYNCDFSTSAAATSGSKATLTIRVLDPADADGVKFLTTTIDVTVGGSVSTETIAFDKAAYAPGEGMTITRTAKDSAGNPVFDGAAAPAITFSKAVGGTAPGASIYIGGTKSSTSSGVQSVFAPSVPGAFTAIATSGNTAGSALSAAASVTDANAGLLTQIDALNAKIVALNALIAKIMKKLGVK